MRAKLTIALLTFIFAQCFASLEAQINISVKNESLEKVFTRIKRQTGYGILFNPQLLKSSDRVTLNLRNANLEQTMNVLLSNRGLTYEIDGKTIVIKKDTGKPDGKRIDYKNPVEYAYVKIPGLVKAKDGNPLVGVSVMVRGKNKGAYSDEKGAFVIEAEIGDIIDVTHIGYLPQTITLGDQKTIDIILVPVDDELDDIVVVAYGTQKKETVTGAIASVQTKEVKQSPAANLAITLAGRLPGLTAMQVTGAPGSDRVDLFLRGLGSINNSTPLIMVDGVERDINYIDPNEVKSVTILKDASSTALFGVRGANGVILVTTRRGNKDQKPEINFSTEYGLQSLARVPHKVNAYDYAQLKNEAAKNDGLTPIYSYETLAHYWTKDLPDIYQDNDWYGMLMRKFTPINRYNLNVSGGGARVNYFVNAGYLYQGGQWNINQYGGNNPQLKFDPSGFLKRYNFRSNIDFSVSNRLKLFLNAAGYLENTNGPSGGNGNWWIFDRINATPALTPGPVDDEGNVVAIPEDGDVPYGLINRAGYSQGTNSNVTASFGFNYDLDFITKGLSAKAMMSFDTKSLYSLSGSRSYYRVVQVIGKTVDGRDTAFYAPRGDGQVNSNLNLTTGTTFQSYTNFQININYQRSFGKHAFTGLVLGQQDKRILTGDPLPYYLIGLSGRFTYAYDSKYFLEFNAGYNGSEQFAKGSRFGFFPAVSGGWLMSKEGFLKDNDAITNLKLRASYGLVGSDRFGWQRFLYLDNIQLGGGGYTGSLGLGQVVNESYIGNRNLQWEVSKALNVGLELELWRHFSLIVDVFQQKRDNVLVSRQNVPGLNGFTGSLAPANIGKIENKGYEIELGYNNSFGNDWRIISKLNFNYAKNTIVDFGERPFAEDYAALYRQTGYSIGQPFGYVVDGFFTSADEIQSYPQYKIQGPRVGDFKYKDMNGDGFIDDRDMVAIGYPSVPQYTYGFAFNVVHKGIDLSFLLQGNANVSQNFTMPSGFLFDFMRNAWSQEKYDRGAITTYPALTLSSSVSNSYPNSFFVTNTSYLRLKNVEIGYALPNNLIRKLNINKVRVYANALNLFTWDKMFMHDFDPEQAGLDAYPIYKVVNFGLNIIF